MRGELVALRTRKIGGKNYYYLIHTWRQGGRIRHREKYLGRATPPNLVEIQRRFLDEVRAERWYPLFDAIRRDYSSEYRKLPKTIREKEKLRFGIEFTYNTNRIEGSRLTLRETAAVLERGVSPPSRPLSDVLETRNHGRVFQEMFMERAELSLDLILDWHRALFRDTKTEIAGRLRNFQAGIGGSRFVPPPPEEAADLIDQLIAWFNEHRRTVHPVELAAIMHLRFEFIHPFGDGNGRVGRLLMNYILHRSGYPMLDIAYTQRERYYDALEDAHLGKGELGFIDWLFRTYVRQHRRHLKDAGDPLRATP